MRHIATPVLALLSAAAVFPAGATVIVVGTTLSGPAEFPPNTSPGTGWARVSVDDALLTMRVEVEFGGGAAVGCYGLAHALLHVACGSYSYSWGGDCDTNLSGLPDRRHVRELRPDVRHDPGIGPPGRIHCR
jgi:hypothetical protein